jgi:hypothetical protein
MKIQSIYDTLKTAAESGDWSSVPKSIQIVPNMLLANEYGRTAIHHAANVRKLNKVPLHLLTLDTMLAATFDGLQPYAIFRQWEMIGAEDDSIPNKLRESILDYLRDRDPRPLFDRFLTCLHAEDWSHLPEDLLTPENAEIKGPRGGNILLRAAGMEVLRTVPRQMITEAALIAQFHFKSYDGRPLTTCALDRAALEELEVIPRDIATRHLCSIDLSIRDWVAEELGLSKPPELA